MKQFQTSKINSFLYQWVSYLWVYNQGSFWVYKSSSHISALSGLLEAIQCQRHSLTNRSLEGFSDYSAVVYKKFGNMQEVSFGSDSSWVIDKHRPSHACWLWSQLSKGDWPTPLLMMLATVRATIVFELDSSCIGCVLGDNRGRQQEIRCSLWVKHSGISGSKLFPAASVSCL